MCIYGRYGLSRLLMGMSDVDCLVMDEEVGVCGPYKCFIALYLMSS